MCVGKGKAGHLQMCRVAETEEVETTGPSAIGMLGKGGINKTQLRDLGIKRERERERERD
jgi:hypothetical protein